MLNSESSNIPLRKSRCTSFKSHLTRAVGSRGFVDVWLLGIVCVISGQCFGWNAVLSAGVGAMLLLTILMGAAYVCLCCCVSEVTGSLPFAGGSYGLARCTLGFFPAFLIGCCEALAYIGAVGTTMIALAGMVVQIAPALAGNEPAIMFVLYASVVLVQAFGTNSFWMGSFVLGLSSLLIWFVYFFSTVGHTDFQLNARDGSPLVIGGAREFLRVFPISAWLYIGIEVLNLGSDDFLHPKTTIPRAQPSCAIALVLISIATVCVTVSLPRSGESIADLSMSLTPLNSGFILGLGVSDNVATALCIPSTYASVYGFVWSYTRLINALASSRLLPPILATKSARFGSANIAMIAGTIVSYVVCVVVFYKTAWVPYVLSVGLLFAFMSYTGQCIGYISLKRSYLREHPSEFKNPLGFVGALYAIVIWLLGFVGLAFFQGNGYVEIKLFSGIIAFVTVFYHAYSKKRQTFSEQENKVLLVAHVMNFNHRRKHAHHTAGPTAGHRFAKRSPSVQQAPFILKHGESQTRGITAQSYGSSFKSNGKV